MLLLSGCDIFEVVQHHNAHIGGYVGIVDTKSESLSGLAGYTNVKEQFYPEHDEYPYFVTKYIFEYWNDNGPSGQAQFWRSGSFGEDWLSEKVPGDNGVMEERPFTKELVVENGYMRLAGVSWQQPWKSWKWKISKADSKEIVLVNDDSKFFYRITKGDRIEAAAGYDEETTSEKERKKY